MKAEDYVHRIGRTGRAGRSGLAMTLAERNDSGMIRRIQQFTTQTIPVATIAGLEPRRPEPKPAAPARFAPARDKGRRAGPGGRPAFGHADRRPGGGAPWAHPGPRGGKPRPAR